MTPNKGLNNIITSLSKIKYLSYEHIQLNAKVKLNYNNKRNTNSSLFKELIGYVKTKLSSHGKNHAQLSNTNQYITKCNIVQQKIPQKVQQKIPQKVQQKIPQKVQQKFIQNIVQKQNIGAPVFGDIMRDGLLQISLTKRSSDFYSQIFFRAINDELDVFTDKEIVNYLKNIKYKVIEAFYAGDIYKRLDYSSKDFKKSELDNVFANNLSVSLRMLRVYGDVLKVNVVYIHSEGMSATFLTFYNKDKATVIIAEDNYSVYALRNKVGGFIRGKEFYKYLYNKNNHSKDELDKFNISSLQNICKLRTIDYKKKGKTKRINKTKKELIEALCNSN